MNTLPQSGTLIFRFSKTKLKRYRTELLDLSSMTIHLTHQVVYQVCFNLSIGSLSTTCTLHDCKTTSHFSVESSRSLVLAYDRIIPSDASMSITAPSLQSANAYQALSGNKDCFKFSKKPSLTETINLSTLPLHKLKKLTHPIQSSKRELDISSLVQPIPLQNSQPVPAKKSTRPFKLTNSSLEYNVHQA